MFRAFTSPAAVSHEKTSDSRLSHEERLRVNIFKIKWDQINNVYSHWDICLILATTTKKQVVCCFIESKLSIFIIGNICLDIIRLSVSASFTEACPAVFQSTRWRPALAVFVPCSLCHVSHCVTICCQKASQSLQHSSSALWHSHTKPVSGRWLAAWLWDAFTNVKAFRLYVFCVSGHIYLQ